jgi:hypothetical protein
MSKSTEELVISSRKLRQTALIMAGLVSEMLRAVNANTSFVEERILAALERSIQASETFCAIEQTNQNAIRDLIAEMREARG